MSTESKFGLGDKIKQKLHFGKPATHTHAQSSSTEHENTALTFGGKPAGLQYEAQDSARKHAPPQQTEPVNTPPAQGFKEGSLAGTTPTPASLPASMQPAEAHQAINFVGVSAGPASIPLAINNPNAPGEQQQSFSQAAPSSTQTAFLDGKQQIPTMLDSISGPVKKQPSEQAHGAHIGAQRHAAAEPSVTDVVSGAERQPGEGSDQYTAGEHNKSGVPKDSVPRSANSPGPQGALQQGMTKVQQVMQPVVEMGKEAGESTKAALGQVQEAAAPYLSSAASQTQQLASLGREKAGQAYSGLSSPGVSKEASEKLAGIQEAVKTYSAVGQERASEYLQQAVVKAEAIGKDAENQSIVVKIVGSLSLVWLAFGFSLNALLGLGLSAAVALVLSRYSRRSAAVARPRSHVSEGAKGHAPDQLQASGVETHYPLHQTGVHPDSSIGVPNARI